MGIVIKADKDWHGVGRPQVATATFSSWSDFWCQQIMHYQCNGRTDRRYISRCHVSLCCVAKTCKNSLNSVTYICLLNSEHPVLITQAMLVEHQCAQLPYSRRWCELTRVLSTANGQTLTNNIASSAHLHKTACSKCKLYHTAISNTDTV